MAEWAAFRWYRGFSLFMLSGEQLVYSGILSNPTIWLSPAIVSADKLRYPRGHSAISARLRRRRPSNPPFPAPLTPEGAPDSPKATFPDRSTGHPSL